MISREAQCPRSPDPRASVIVLNYNGRRYLDACLEALLGQQLGGGFEVLFVDNASGDGSLVHVRKRWPAVRAIDAGQNLGFAAANNLGVTRARGQHVVLLNNDTRVRPGWLVALVAAAESEEHVGAVTSKLVFMDRPGVIQNAGSLVLTDGSGGDRGSGEQDQGQYDRREEVFAACGCGMLLTRAMLEDVGLLDPTFFAYYEDTDLSWRMRLRGWRVIYEPAALVEHVHSGTSVEWSPFFTFHVDRNRLFMILKNAPPGFLMRSLARFAWLYTRFALRPLARRARQRPVLSAGSPGGSSRARVQVHVVASLLAHLPEMVVKRWHIRRRRQVSDSEILGWFFPRDAR